VTISCGLTEFRAGDTPTAVYERADRALYQAKQQGRNRCVAVSRRSAGAASEALEVRIRTG
jgi:PleD family two-component response regulator